MAIPISRRCYRDLAPDFQGQVIIADIDRTYLATRFSTVRGMATIPFEAAIDKQDIPGMARLLRELRRGPNLRSAETPLFFISASPAQLRRTIEAKLTLDGIGFDGTLFKDWVRVVLSGRWRGLKDQLVFKLTALLLNRLALPRAAEEILLGDDLESDPVAYALYADLLAGRLEAHRAQAALVRAGARPREAAALVEAARRVRGHRPPRRALIRLERTTPDDLGRFAGHVVACQGALQMALAAFADGALSPSGVVRVAGTEFRGRVSMLRGQIEDGLRRGLVRGPAADRVLAALRQAHLLDPAPVPAPVKAPCTREHWFE